MNSFNIIANNVFIRISRILSLYDLNLTLFLYNNVNFKNGVIIISALFFDVGGRGKRNEVTKGWKNFSI